MSQKFNMLRLPDAMKITGLSRRSFYRAVSAGLLPPPIKISDRATAFPSHEIEEINRARLAGLDEDAIKKLVERQILLRSGRAA